MIYKTFQKVSNVCQLLDKRKFNPSQTINGVTFTNNGDGTITVNGTATEYTAYHLQYSQYFPYNLIGRICLIESNLSLPSGNTIRIHTSNWDITDRRPIGKITSVFSIWISVFQGYTANNLVFKPQFFDLTEMYGAGNEPTTVEQFQQDFPEEMYDYSPHCFVKSYKDCLKVSDYCQLLDKSKYPATTTKAGVTFTNNGDGTITVNGTATSAIPIELLKQKADEGHKYLVSGCPSNGRYGTYRLEATIANSSGNYVNGFSDNGDGNISPIIEEGQYIFVRISIWAGVNVSNLVFKPQLFDLTEMYGAGNEPTTIEQFRADFPDELYDYKPYSIVPSYKKSLVCKTKNLFDINSVTDIKHVTTDRILPHTLWSIKNNSLITKVNYYDIGACIFLPTLNLEPGTYTLSAYCVSNHPRCFVGIRDFNKSKWFHEAYNTNTQIEYKFEITEKSEIGLMLQGLDSNLIVTFSNIQLELGSTATEYHPYGYL